MSELPVENPTVTTIPVTEESVPADSQPDETVVPGPVSSNVGESMMHALMELGVHTKNEAHVIVSHLIERGFGFHHESPPPSKPMPPVTELSDLNPK